MSRLKQIRAFGQRVWLDNLSRQLLSEKLGQMLTDDGIAGVTSNPAIFYNAISKDVRYQADLAELKTRPLSAEQRYEALVVPDIQAACDLLRSQYEESGRDDGYVSLEVSPFLAQDTEGTLAAARRLWTEVDRPNLMIKVPATAAGLPAFTRLIAEGINVNITLIFSQGQADAVFAAYIAGLSQRLADDQPIDHVRAVASLFLSRVDTLIDARLQAIGSEAALALQGKSAISLAKSAWRRHHALFASTGFSGLQAAGGHPQKLLWASTGTKNPAYRDVMYVEELIGPDTINTVPDATLDAFRDHGVAASRLTQGLEEVDANLAALAALGIDLEEVGAQLQRDGLVLFDDAFAKLLSLMA